MSFVPYRTAGFADGKKYAIFGVISAFPLSPPASTPSGAGTAGWGNGRGRTDGLSEKLGEIFAFLRYSFCGPKKKGKEKVFFRSFSAPRRVYILEADQLTIYGEGLADVQT